MNHKILDRTYIVLLVACIGSIIYAFVDNEVLGLLLAFVFFFWLLIFLAE